MIFSVPVLKVNSWFEDHLQEIIRRTSEYRRNSIVIGPGLGLGPEKGIRDETKKTVYFIFSPASPSNHLLEAFYQNMPEYPPALLGG